MATLPLSALRGYQKQAVDWLHDREYALLLMDMGTGKTITTLTHLASVGGRTLIVAPLRVCESVWMQEAEGWEHTQHLRFSLVTGSARARSAALAEDADVYLINYENLVWLTEQTGYISSFDNLVMDEISYMKNTTSSRFKKFRKHIPSFKRRYGLTGTPVSNKLLDLFGITYILDQGERFGRAITPFKTTYFYQPNPYDRWTLAPHEGTEKMMFDALADMSYRIPAAGYVDIPPVVPIDITVALPPEVRASYDELEKKFFTMYGDGQIMAENAPGLINKLQQLAQGFVYGEYDDDDVMPIHDQKIIALREIVEQLQGQPLLVGYTYQQDREVLLECFPEARVLDTAEDIDAWNRGEIPILLLHPKSGAHGLNMQHGGCHLCLFGLNWSLELYQQLIGRLARPGQDADHVYLFRIIAQNTIDEAILFSVEEEKQGRQARFLDSVELYGKRKALMGEVA